MLIELKAVTPYREYQTRVSEIGIEQRHSSRLMTLARNLPLLQERKPGRLHTSGVMLSATHHYGAL